MITYSTLNVIVLSSNQILSGWTITFLNCPKLAGTAECGYDTMWEKSSLALEVVINLRTIQF